MKLSVKKMFWFGLQLAFGVKMFFEWSESPDRTHQELKIILILGRHDAVPSHRFILKLVEMLKYTSSTVNAPRSEPSRTSSRPENVEVPR